MEAKNRILKELLVSYDKNECIALVDEIIYDYSVVRFMHMKELGSSVTIEHNQLFFLKKIKEAFNNVSNFDSFLIQINSTKGWMKMLNEIIYDYSTGVIELSRTKNDINPENCTAHLCFLKLVIESFEASENEQE